MEYKGCYHVCGGSDRSRLRSPPYIPYNHALSYPSSSYYSSIMNDKLGREPVHDVIELLPQPPPPPPLLLDSLHTPSSIPIDSASVTTLGLDTGISISSSTAVLSPFDASLLSPLRRLSRTKGDGVLPHSGENGNKSVGDRTHRGTRPRGITFAMIFFALCVSSFLSAMDLVRYAPFNPRCVLIPNKMVIHRPPSPLPSQRSSKT